MRLRTQFYGVIVVFGTILLLTSVLVLLGVEEGNRLEARELRVRNIELKIQELNTVLHNYMLQRTPRGQERWEIVYSSLVSDAATLVTESPAQRILADRIGTGLVRLREQFTAAVLAVQGIDPESVPLPDAWSATALQLQAMQLDASRLAEEIRSHTDLLFQRIGHGALLSYGVLCAFLFTMYFRVCRRVMHAVTSLREGTRMIGSGCLDFTLAETADDEIGEFSRAFNRMTTSLKSVMTSRADLEKEIGERKQVEAVLRKSEHRLRLALEGAEAGMWQRTSSGELQVTPRFNSLFGLPEDAPPMNEREFMSFIFPEDIPVLKSFWRDAIENGTPFDQEFRVQRPDGSIRWLASKGKVTPGTGLGKQFIGITYDITRTRRMEEQILESERKYRDLVRYAPTGIFELDYRKREFLSANDAMCMLTGYTRDELLRKDPFDLFDAEGREKLMNRLESRQYGKESEDGFEYRVIGKDGHGIYATLSLKYLLDEFGQRIGATIIVHDITARRRIEETLREAKEAAEAARSAAESANQAKSEFLAHMSHEIRTPIGGIIGLIDVLSSREMDDETRSYLSLIREAAESLLIIIGDILDLSRIEAGIIEFDPCDWKLRKEVEVLIAQFRVHAEKKGLTLTLRVGDDVPERVRTDGEKIIRILRNLVSNAIKYTENGRVSVTVEQGGEGLPGEAARKGKIPFRFSVSDTGIGIASDKQEEVFESFVRLKTANGERAEEGTGLGLTITKRLVEIIQGKLVMESTEGRGSTFSFCVDVEPAGAEEPALRAEPVSRLTELGKLSIIVAEDNRINQIFLEIMLKNAGHTVTIARNGKEVLDVLRESGTVYDLVLMDIQMPVMDGLEAARKIRALAGPAAGIPIIALTAFAMKGDEDRFTAAGMNGYVTKPVDWEDLAQVIRCLLS